MDLSAVRDNSRPLFYLRGATIFASSLFRSKAALSLKQNRALTRPACGDIASHLIHVTSGQPEEVITSSDICVALHQL